MRSIKVLIVDASPVFRDLITNVLRNDPAVTVVAAVRDPIEARDAILKFDPAVMVLGVELPRMNGIEFLRKLMPQYPVATIVFGHFLKRFQISTLYAAVCSSFKSRWNSSM